MTFYISLNHLYLLAVVALLKKSGAANRLTYTVIGEALLNDGTALVLYNLLFSLIKSDTKMFTIKDVVVYFVRVIFISPLLGASFGFMSLLVISLANRRTNEGDTTVQMAITIGCAYVSFYVGERLVQVSGVITCCAAGLVLARFAEPMILKIEAHNSIWAAFVWFGNTLIFILAGLIIGKEGASTMRPIDLAYILITFIIVLLVRAAMILICFPFLQRLGKGCTVQEAVFMTWGGLRGAVSTAIALSLVRSTQKGETNLNILDAQRLFFLVGGTAALTLLVCGTSSGTVLKKLNLLNDQTQSYEMKIMYQYVKKRIRWKAIELLRKIKEKYPKYVVPDIVVEFLSILRDSEDVPLPVSEALKSSSFGNHSHVASRMPVTLSGDFKSQLTGSEDARGKAPGSFDFDSPEKDRDVHRELFAHDEFKASDSRKMRDRVASNPEGRPHNRRSNSIFYPEPGRNGYELTRGGLDNSEDGEGEGEDDDENKENRKKAERRRLAQLQSISAQAHSRPIIYTELLFNMRRAFLEVVRVSYWRQIESGRLPRKSNAALILLSSVDFALETTNTPGLQDWDYIYDSHEYLFKDLKRKMRPKNLIERIASTLIPESVTESVTDLAFGEVAVHSISSAKPSEHSGEHQQRANATSENLNKDPPSSMLSADNKVSTETVSGTGENAARVLKGPATSAALHASDEEATSPVKPVRSATKLFDDEPRSVTSKDTIEIVRQLTAARNIASTPKSVSKFKAHSTTAAKVLTSAATVNNTTAATVAFEKNTQTQYRHAQVVYILTSFIEAHEYAQRKIPYFLGDTEGIDTPEEDIVVRESMQLVVKAKRKLNMIDPEVIAKQLSKQAARCILNMQETEIESYLKEGILTEKDAEILMREVEHDFQELGRVNWLRYLAGRLVHVVGYAMYGVLFPVSEWIRSLRKQPTKNDEVDHREHLKQQNKASDLQSDDEPDKVHTNEGNEVLIDSQEEILRDKSALNMDEDKHVDNSLRESEFEDPNKSNYFAI